MPKIVFATRATSCVAILIATTWAAQAQQPLNEFTKGGIQVTLEDLGMGTRPVGDVAAVRVVPWGNLGGGIAQMATQDGRIFFGRTDGLVLEYDSAGNQINTLLDIAQLRGEFFSNGGPFSGRGLRGIAFHPDFATPGMPGEGKFYTMHKENASGGSLTHGITGSVSTDHYTLGEWDFGNLTDGDPSFRSVMRIGIFFDGDGNTGGHHAASQLAFNPTASPGESDYGNLYFGVGDVRYDGDGGSAGTRNVGQDTSNVLGSVLRIDPLRSAVGDFTIPEDNPFTQQSARDEIFAYGFRNPSTISFDHATGRLFIGDISEHLIEEINLVESGGNYGWGIREGAFAFEGDQNNLANQNPSTYIPLGNGTDVDQFSTTVNGVSTNRLSEDFITPVARFSHQGQVGSNFNAIIAGPVYHGTLASELQGLYLFGNLSNDDVFYAQASDLVNNGIPAEVFELALQDQHGTPAKLGEIVGVGPDGRVNARFGQDDAGEIYLISKADNVIYRLEGTEIPRLPSILGDLNLDSIIDQTDIDLFVAGWYTTGEIGEESWMRGDLSLDGFTDLADLYLMHQALGRESAALLLETLGMRAVVPEPNASTYLVAALLTLFSRRRTSVRIARKQTA